MGSEDVYITGIDMIKFGKFPDRSIASLGAESALGALDDAGVTINDIQALYSGNLMMAAGMVGQQIQQEIGQTGIPVVNTSNACATGATALREGWTAIKAGIYDTVLAVGVEKLAGAGMLGGGGGGSKGIHPEGLLGSASMPCVFAEAGMAHSRMYGTTFEQFAQIAVKNHHHSTMNPKARYQIETPLEEVMSAEMISYPNTKLMCSANVDGSAAAVLMSEKKVKELGLTNQAVKIRASVLTTDPWTIATRSCPTSAPARETRRRRPMKWPGSAQKTSTSSNSTTASPPPRCSTTKTSASAPTVRRAR